MAPKTEFLLPCPCGHPVLALPSDGMRVAMMTREYPPEVYGGAGVHVTELVAQLRRLCDVDVHCMGAPRPGQPDVFVHRPDPKTGPGVRWATPLFLALVLVEFVDLIFAVDSVPAIFAITTDPFIVYTSNIFAILGLRALYFALAAMIHRFKYLKYALALVLVFIGSKIFLVGIIGKIPAVISLSVTFGLIAGGVLVSLWKTRGAPTAVDAR